MARANPPRSIWSSAGSSSRNIASFSPSGTLGAREEVDDQRQEAPTAHADHVFADPRHGFRGSLRTPDSPAAPRRLHRARRSLHLHGARPRCGARAWIATGSRQLYSFAVHPDITFYFRVPLEISLQRILEGRPRSNITKPGSTWAGAPIPTRASASFQGKVFAEYEAMRQTIRFHGHRRQRRKSTCSRPKCADSSRADRSSPPLRGPHAGNRETSFFGRRCRKSATRSSPAKLFVIEGRGWLRPLDADRATSANGSRRMASPCATWACAARIW